MSNPEHMTATKLAIQNKEYWDNFKHVDVPGIDELFDYLVDTICFSIIRHHYIKKYFAKWGWK